MRNVASHHTPPPGDALAQGVGDEIVREKTGRDWDEWHAILDARGVNGEGFAEMVRFLSGEYDLSAWWATTIAAHYRRKRGLQGP